MADVAEMTRLGQMGAIGSNGGGGKAGGVLADGASGYTAWIATGGFLKLNDVNDHNGVKKISDGIVTNKVDGFGLFRQTKAGNFHANLTSNIPNNFGGLGPAGNDSSFGLDMQSVPAGAPVAPMSSAAAASSAAASSRNGDGGGASL